MIAQPGHLLSRIIEETRPWHYEGGRRDLRLDLLRGFAALVMIVDHIGGQGSWLYPLTGGNRFVVSAAEAFVFISGVVMGIVYLNVLVRQGLAVALMKAFHRAWMLYVVTIVLTLTSALLASWLDLWWAPDVSSGGVAQYVFEVVTLNRTIYLVDVLLMYTFFLLAAGPVILLLSQGKTLIVLALSWAIWLAWQISPESTGVMWQIQENTVFNVAAWQVLFVNGIVIGWHHEQIETWARKLPTATVAGVIVLVSVLVLLLYIAQVTNVDALEQSSILFTLAFDRPQLPIGRLAVFALLAIFSYAGTTLLWTPIRRITGWLLLPLGQNALTAYALHIYLVAALTWITIHVVQDRWPEDLVSTLMQVGGVLLVWLFVRYEPGVREQLVDGFVVPAWRHFRPPRDAEVAS